MTEKRRFILISSLVTIGIAVSGGLLNVALTNMRGAPQQVERRPPSTAVGTRLVERQTFRERLVGYGKARPRTITDMAASVAGDVNWVSPNLDPGHQVRESEELVRLDDRDLQNAVAAAEARLEQSESTHRQQQLSAQRVNALRLVAKRELDAATRSHARIEELRQRNAISDEEFDASLLQLSQRERAYIDLDHQAGMGETEIARAAAEVDAAQAALERAQIDLDRAVICAPYDGFISERMVNLGARVAVGTALFQIVDNSRIEIPIALPAAEYAAVRPGSKATVRAAEDGPAVWSGEVQRVSPMIDDRDRTFFAYLSLPGGEVESVAPGSFVVAEIEATEHSDVVVVPRTALLGNHLFVAVPDPETDDSAMVERRTPGVRRLLTDVALLDGGVKVGERIIVTNVEKVEQGSRVRVVVEESAE